MIIKEWNALDYSYVENFIKEQRNCREAYGNDSWLKETEALIAPAITQNASSETLTRLVIARKPYSNHPEDYYLRVALVETNNAYVVWEENTQDTARCRDTAFFQGSYFDKSALGLGRAMKEFNRRGSVTVYDCLEKVFHNEHGLDQYSDVQLKTALDHRGYKVTKTRMSK